MFSFKNNIFLDRQSNRNLYLQLCDQIIGFIKSGKIAPSSKLPGSRKLAEDLKVHRKTVIAAYDELIAQGWIQTIPSRGTFINSSLPVVKPKIIGTLINQKVSKNKAAFNFLTKPNLIRKTTTIDKDSIVITDGVPDHRLAPIEEIAKTYRNLTKKKYNKRLLAYNSIYGDIELRKALKIYLNQTRGLHISVDNILITRGSQMGIYLASALIIHSGKIIVVGNTNYMTADDTFIETGGTIERVPVDKEGLDTKVIEKLCKQKNIEAVYVTSHHHHPTTVTLSAERRMHLLALAETYHFAIIEDDYDYDFHYSNAPILPLASNDHNGNVIYIGAFSKIIAPAIRIGYLIAPKNFVDEAAKLRRIIDRQGDPLLELTLSRMIKSGDIQRHSNKVLKIYKTRRNLFCKLLKEKLGNYFDFEIPDGGMAVWVQLHKRFHWDDVMNEATKLKLVLGEWKRYDTANTGHGGIRMGFASLNDEEIKESINRIEKIMKILDTQINYRFLETK